jgi:hypothetical protein
MSRPVMRRLPVSGVPAGLRLAAAALLSAGLLLAGTAGPSAGEGCIAGEPARRRIAADVLSDHEQFYSAGPLRDLSLGLLGAWLLANSEADVEVQDWYRDRVRTAATDDLSGWVKPLGNGRITVPALSGALLAGVLLRRVPAGRTLTRWSGRSLRALALGAPPLLFLQVATGGSRPRENDSRWRPFEDDNGVSGHSFVGAVPFLSAAAMTESRPLKALFYSGSTLCGLSRINDDAHYLSQAAMGWWVAYLSCRSVQATEENRPAVRCLPELRFDGRERVSAAVTVTVIF